jgi:hypothetical protein
MISRRHQGLALGATAFLAYAISADAVVSSAVGMFQPDVARIIDKVDDNRVSAVQGSVSPKIAIAQDLGALPGSQRLQDMTLLLKRSPEKQSRYDAYVSQLTNPSSPQFHKWLTAVQIGEMFGPAKSDIAQVTSWLTSHGLRVDQVTPTNTIVRFSGSAAAVGAAFHTQIHSFTLKGANYFANVSVQQLPVALTPVVKGVVSLDNFFAKPQHQDVATVKKSRLTGKWSKVKPAPNFTTPPNDIVDQPLYEVAPPDFAKIYNVNPLWNRQTPIRGAGQTIAVLERSDVLPADITTFRSAFLPSNAIGAISYVNPIAFVGDSSCPDPGTNADESEAALDAEWIGAAAPDANVVFASCDDSNSPSFGPFTAALNLLNAGTPPPSVFSLSYGECEVMSANDTTSDAGEIWEQAAAEGTTVVVSSGDAGSAGCDQDEPTSTFGINVNTMSSTPYNLAVGGTDFDDYNNQAAYWLSTNLANGLSAISYIPEQTWNDTCASSKLDSLIGVSDPVTVCNSANGMQYLGTSAGSGGPSIFWPQPVWQVGIYGAPNSHSRMQPDVSLFAASGFYGHALIYCMSDSTENGTPCDYSNPDDVVYNSGGGTSFAAPAMAGIQALINQAAGIVHGNIAPTLYDIANKEYGTNASPNLAGLASCNSSNGSAIGTNCIFNDVTQGGIDVPCTAGTSDCFSGANANHYGVLSSGGSVSLEAAWQTNGGYDYATGLGTINAANLVDAVVAHDVPYLRGYAAPGDFLGTGQLTVGDGYSDIALVDPVAGSFTAMAMKGSTVLNSSTLAIASGYTIGVSGYLFPVVNGLFTDQPRQIGSLAWTGPDNQLYVWLSNGVGAFSPYQVGGPFPDGWKLVGGGNFDSNGRDQLLWRNDATGQIGWWTLHYFFSLKNQGGREVHVYNVSATISPLLSAPSGYVPTIADVNGDGYADIVWTNPSDNSVYVWINNQAGDFVRHRIADHPAGFTLYGSGDLNGDGKTDLVWTNPAAHQMAWWVMNGFTVADQEVLNVTPGYVMSSVADYDGDGLADILWVGKAGDMYEWQGTGSGFHSFRVTDSSGIPVVVPQGASVQALRFQGSAATGGVSVSSD